MKCNGLNPCNTCSKRSLSCTYASSENGSDDINAPSPKRRLIHSAASSGGLSPEDVQSPPLQPPQRMPSWGITNGITPEKANGGSETNVKLTSQITGTPLKQESKSRLSASDAEPRMFSADSNVGQDEEAVVYSNNRMLQDPTGRLRMFSSIYVLQGLMCKSPSQTLQVTNHCQYTSATRVLCHSCN